MQRIVIATSVIASASRNRNGASRAILELVAMQRLTPLATPALFLQYEAVLTRPEQLPASGFNSSGIDRFLPGLASAIEPVAIHLAWRPQLPDPDDEMVFDAAVNGRADALVTHNVRDFRQAALRFDVTVMQPVEVLREVLK